MAHIIFSRAREPDLDATLPETVFLMSLHRIGPRKTPLPQLLGTLFYLVHITNTKHTGTYWNCLDTTKDNSPWNHCCHLWTPNILLPTPVPPKRLPGGLDFCASLAYKARLGACASGWWNLGRVPTPWPQGRLRKCHSAFLASTVEAGQKVKKHHSYQEAQSLCGRSENTRQLVYISTDLHRIEWKTNMWLKKTNAYNKKADQICDCQRQSWRVEELGERWSKYTNFSCKISKYWI